MSAEENMAIERRIADAFAKGNVNILDEVCSADYVYHSPAAGSDWGREDIKKAMAMMYAAFPDWQIGMDDLFAAGDKVVLRITVRGTHRGALWGVAPTGKTMTWTSFIIARFAGGKIVEEWQMADFLGLYRQLGLVSLPQ